jgi:hypothetical protein
MTLRISFTMIMAELLGELFGHFIKLRVIRLDEKTFVGQKMVGPIATSPLLGMDEFKHNNGIVESYMHSIVSNCWALEEILVRCSDIHIVMCMGNPQVLFAVPIPVHVGTGFAVGQHRCTHGYY